MSATAKLIAAIGLNSDAFKNGIASVNGDTDGLKKNFGDLKRIIADAFSVYAIMNFMRGLASTTKEINAAAMESGSTTTGFQALREAMDDAGLSGDKAGAALGKVNGAIIDALGGGTKAIGAFNQLGISMENIAGKSTDEVFGMIAEAVYGAQDKTAAYGAVVDILGTKLGTVLLPTLRMVGQEGFGKLTDRMRECGQILDEVMIARILNANDILDDSTTRLKIWGLALVDFFGATIAGVIGGLKTLFSGEGFSEGFSLTALTYAQNYGDAINEIVQKQKDANAQMLDSNRAVAEESAAIAKKQADIAAAAAEAAAARAIEAAVAVTGAQWAALETAEGRYSKAVENARLSGMTSEEKLAEAIARRAALIVALQKLENDRNKFTLEWYNTATEILTLTGEIEKSERELGKTTTGTLDEAKTARLKDVALTKEQVAAIGDLRDLLKGMTDHELAEFIGKIALLHKGLQGLDFSNLAGLSAISNLKIPNESKQNAKQFGEALKLMADAMAGLKLPDLAPLAVLKDFKIPNESILNARQFARSIVEMIDGLNNAKIDLGPIQKVADLFTALKGGAIQIEIAAPTRDALMLSLPEGMDTRLASIDGHLATLAGLKGVLYS